MRRHPITRPLDAAQSDTHPSALLASLGCGNPTALARLAPGEVCLSRVRRRHRHSPDGAPGWPDRQGLWTRLDRRNAVARSKSSTSRTRQCPVPQRRIESIPLPDDTVDVVISNCVINLSCDKTGAAETFRLLKPVAVSPSPTLYPRRHPAGPASGLASMFGCLAGLSMIGLRRQARGRRFEHRDRAHPRPPDRDAREFLAGKAST